MTPNPTSDAIHAVHAAVLTAKHTAEAHDDSRLFHLRQISAYTGRLVEGMGAAPEPVFSSVRAPVCHLTPEQAAQAAATLMARRSAAPQTKGESQ